MPGQFPILARNSGVFASLTRLGGLLRRIGLRIGVLRPPALVNFVHLADFVEKNASFVSQVALYTYVKARAGTSFPKLFRHEEFLTSLHIARWHIFAAAVVDLAVFSAEQLLAKTAPSQVANQAASESPDRKNELLVLARQLGEMAFAGIKQQDVSPAVFSGALVSMNQRLRPRKKTDATRPTPFFASADAFWNGHPWPRSSNATMRRLCVTPLRCGGLRCDASFMRGWMLMRSMPIG